ncbi:DUF6611 family protein [Mycobacterium sp. 2YAF39]|uniref:DUF6611 family protein n=1 Tax=Mycobacterium sp. 2YAF39 TaxID=3233033 RepID=UPI003F9B6A48
MSKSHNGVLRCAWHQLLDGDRPWGSVSVRPDRFGVTRYRLVVYPPGISPTERRRVRAARGWPLWGAAVWITAQIYLSNVLNPWTALAVSISATLVLGVVTVSLADPVRTQVRTMTAAVLVGHPDLGSNAARDTIQRLGVRLIRADESLADGRLGSAEHEAIWWSVYDEMAPQSSPVSQE